MPIEIKAAQSKSWAFYISNGKHNIIVNVGRELRHPLRKFIPWGLDFTFEGKPVNQRGIITQSNWEGELSSLDRQPLLKLPKTDSVLFKSPTGDLLNAAGSSTSVYGATDNRTIGNIAHMTKGQYVLVFYPDTFEVWDKHYITGLCLINPNALIKDLI